MELDIKYNLYKYMPSFFKLIHEGSFSWNDINKSFLAVLNKRRKEYKTKNELISREYTFFDAISAALNGNEDGLLQATYFEYIFEELDKNLSSSERKLIKNTLKHLLTNYDIRHRNFLSELSVLNYFMSTGKFGLLSVEHFTNKGKRVDFMFREKEGGWL